MRQNVKYSVLQFLLSELVHNSLIQNIGGCTNLCLYYWFITTATFYRGAQMEILIPITAARVLKHLLLIVFLYNNLMLYIIMVFVSDKGQFSNVMLSL